MTDRIQPTDRAEPTGRLLALLSDPPTRPDTGCGYLNLLGDQAQAGPGTGITQRLMRTRLVPVVYERYWRPALGRVAKGRTGPSMADEHQLAGHLLNLSDGQTVLDVACGTGGFTRMFGCAVGPAGLAVGLDASAPMLARAIREPDGGNVAYLRADAVRPPLRDGSVHAVCCFAALHMFAEPVVALDSFARVLRPGGRLALLTSGRRPTVPLRAMDTVIGRLSGQHMFDRGEVGDLLRERGFDRIEERFAGTTQFVGGRLTG